MPFKAAILDMDGVITQTAKLHAKAWKQMFDEFLEKREGKSFKPMTIEEDYKQHINGKPRYKGVRTFLQSRNIVLPEGSPQDSPDQETVVGLGMRKNNYFLDILEKEGVQLYQDTITMVRKWKEEGIKLAVVSSSRNCKWVMEAAGVLDLFEVRVDGMMLEELKLKGKPDPDIFLKAAEMLGVTPQEAIVVEDAISGVEAGRKGNFKLVVGVARKGEEEALKEKGADVVVHKLTELQNEMEKQQKGRVAEELPHAIENLDKIKQTIGDKEPVLFFDYDGTLSPIVQNPQDAILSVRTKAILQRLADEFLVAVVSGRDRADVKEKVGLENVFYAGSHGFDISGPDGMDMQYEGGLKAVPALEDAEKNLKKKLAGVKGVKVERKKYAIAVHYRNVAEEEVPLVKSAVYEELDRQDKLKKGGGKKILELKPDIDWHKGRATRWLLETLQQEGKESIPLFLGDDVTDEDALAAIADDGIGILVGTHGERTAATYRLNDTDEVADFLEHLYDVLKKSNGT